MIDSLELIRRAQIIQDSGPIYNEFNADAVVLEPWNAYSSLIFFVPVIFWIFRLRGEYSQHGIILALLPFLFLNGLGSTLFHAFRAHNAWLFLDFMPASFMSIILSTYFWTKLVNKWYWGLLVVIGFYVVAIFSINGLTQIEGMEEMAPNIGYFFVGCSIFFPILVYLKRLRWKYTYLVLLSILFLGLALLCRTLDYPTPNPFPEALPQGTHFLWHVFSSFAVFTMGYFVYNTKKLDLARRDSIR